MAKVVSRYKGKIYVNEANYSAGLLMADVWKDTVEYKVGDVFRIVHRGIKTPNRIHLERIPMQDKVSLAVIKKYKKSDKYAWGEFCGSQVFYLSVEEFIKLIEVIFNYNKFLSKELSLRLRKSQDLQIDKMLNGEELSHRKINFQSSVALNQLVERGYAIKEGKYYSLLKNPIVSKTLHSNYKGGLNSSQP